MSSKVDNCASASETDDVSNTNEGYFLAIKEADGYHPVAPDDASSSKGSQSEKGSAGDGDEEDGEQEEEDEGEEVGSAASESENAPFSITKFFDYRVIYPSLLKETDQISPLNLKKMSITIQVVVMFLLFSAWCIAFFYQIDMHFNNCNESNGCRTCSVTVDPAADQDCQLLAVNTLRIAAGCVSVEIPNSKLAIDDIFQTAIDNLENDRSDTFPADLYTSMKNHYAIYSAVRYNDNEQMIDPDVYEVSSFLNTYSMGYDSMVSAVKLNKDYPTTAVFDAMSAAGLKTIYAFLAIACIMDTSAAYRIETKNGINYAVTDILPKNIRCPTSREGVEYRGNFDVSVLDTDRSNGLATVTLGIPTKYVQLTDSVIPENSAGEPLFYNPTSLQFEHCGTNVFTSTPGTLKNGFSSCCSELTALDKMSLAYAFAGLVLTAATIVTTLMFWRWNPKLEKGDEELDDILVNGLGEIIG